MESKDIRDEKDIKDPKDSNSDVFYVLVSAFLSHRFFAKYEKFPRS